MTIRHRIIRWLAQGDLIILNAQFTRWGQLRSKEAGGVHIDNCELFHNHDYAIGINSSLNSALSLEAGPTQICSIENSLFMGPKP